MEVDSSRAERTGELDLLPPPAAIVSSHKMPPGQAAGSTLEQELNKLSLSSADGEELIAAFEADADQKKRAVATLALSKGASDQEQLASLYAPLARRLRDESNSKAYASALRLLSTLANLAPPAAQAILFAEGSSKPLWTTVWPKVGNSETLLDLLRADLLATLANDGASRASALKETGLMAWLRAAAPTAASEGGNDRIALVAHLALYKLQQRPSSSQEGIPAAEKPQRDSKDDDAFYRLAKVQILAANTETLNEEQSRIALLAGLESLSYLSSSSSAFKDLIANDAPFLQALCRLPSSLGQQKGRRAVFPSRGQSASGPSSSYQLDSAMGANGVTPADSSAQYALSTIILNLVAYPPVLSGEEKQMEKLRAMASAKQQQQQGGQASAGQEEKESTSKVDARVIKAIDAGVVDMLVSIALSGVDSTGAAGLNASTAVRDAISTVFLHLTVRQDKQQRGRIAQAGGTKALVALSSDVLARLRQQAQPTPAANTSQASSSKQTTLSPPLSALQSLARLCITTSPALLFGGSDTSSSSMAAVTSTLLPFFCTLYLDASSDALQRFEALLALTNLASLSPQAARAVATGKVAAASAKKGGETTGKVGEDQRPTTILDGLEDSIFLSSNDMIRRAAVELLCNLVQDDLAFARWSGEEEEEEAQKKKAKGPNQEVDKNDAAASRAQHRLHLLVALCAPAAGGAETSLPTRMAASGALASLCSSPVACSHVLALRARTVNIIARLVRPGVAVKAGGSQQQGAKIVELKDDDEADNTGADEGDEAVDEEEEARLELQDAQSWPQGASHARASLAIRGVTIASCLVQYVAWRRGGGGADAEEKKLQDSGLLDALKQAALEGAREMQQQRNTVTSGGREGAIVQEVRAMRGEVTQIALEGLKEVSRWGKMS